MRRSLPAILLTGLIGLTGAGCPGGDPDFDGDGADDIDDCDPEDPLVYPGAPDGFGDGVDSDCDGFDGAGDDRDLDGLSGALDCDDQDPAINTNADEVCDDGVDNDCDGQTDADDPDCGGDDDDATGADDDDATGGDDDDATGDDDDATGDDDDDATGDDDDDATGDDDDDATGDDDDDATGDDDDDATAPGGMVTEISFELALSIEEGAVEALLASVYWADSAAGDVICRHFLEAEGMVEFGDGLVSGCANCTGRIDLDPASLVDVSQPGVEPEHCDPAALIAAGLSYGPSLLTPAPAGFGDFLTTALIDAGRLCRPGPRDGPGRHQRRGVPDHPVHVPGVGVRVRRLPRRERAHEHGDLLVAVLLGRQQRRHCRPRRLALVRLLARRPPPLRQPVRRARPGGRLRRRHLLQLELPRTPAAVNDLCQRAISCQVKEGKGERGGVFQYAAQASSAA